MPIVWLVLPEQRCLSPLHLLAIIGRGMPMAQAVAKACGGFWLVDVSTLQRQVDARGEEQDVRLAELAHDEEPLRSPAGTAAMVDWLTF